MPATILLKDEPIKGPSFVVGAFQSKNGEFVNYYWYDRTSEELRDKLRLYTMEKPVYFVRVIPK